MTLITMCLHIADKAILIFLVLFALSNFLKILDFQYKNRFFRVLTASDFQQTAFWIILIYFTLNRLPTMFVAERLTGNPDEFNYIINAFNVKIFAFNWDNLDHGTSGVLNATVLGWPAILGLDITIFSTRLTNAVLIGISLVSIWKCIELGTNKTFANLSLFFSTLFFSHSHFLTPRGTTDIHYHVAYVSESLPVALLSFSALALYVCIKKSKDLNWGFNAETLILSVGALAVGAVPYSKLQAAPMGLLVALLCIWFLRNNKKMLLHTFIFATVPTLFILLPLSLRGNFDHFLIPYILNNYFRGDLYPWQNWQDTAHHLLKLSITQVFLILFLISGAQLALKRRFLDSVFQSEFLWVSIMLSSVATIVNVMPRMNSDHYNHFTVIFIPLAATVLFFHAFYKVRQPDHIPLGFNLFNILRINAPINGIEFSFSRFLLVVLILFPVYHFKDIRYELMHKHGRNHLSDAFRNFTDLIENPRFLDWSGSGDESQYIYVWGWEPRYYVWADLMPASKLPWFEHVTLDQFWMLRDQNKAQSHKSIRDYTKWFQKDLMQDLKRNRPRYIIDANTKNGIGYDHLNFKSIKYFAEFDSFLKTGYVKYTRFHKAKECPMVYLERSYANAVSSTELQYSIVTEPKAGGEYPASNLHDNSFSYQCKDYWRAEGAPIPEVNLSFGRIRKVSAISMMGMPGMQRGEYVRMDFFKQGRAFKNIKMKIKKFPRWTHLPLPYSIRADRVKLGFVETGHARKGLSELKFFSSALK